MSRIFLVLCLMALFVGCAKSSKPYAFEDGYGIAADAMTLEMYRSRKAIVDVLPGNRNPEISWATLYANMPGDAPVFGTNASGERIMLKAGTKTKKTFTEWMDDPVALQVELDRRYSKAFRSILKDKGLKSELIAAGKAHGIDPVLILACVLGENTFNVGLVDDIQVLAVLAADWAAKWALKFKANGVDLVELVKRPEFDPCTVGLRSGGTHAVYWNCVIATWNSKFLGRTIDGVKYPYDGFRGAFFNPIGTGFTYGLGQLDPIRALMVTDEVNKKSGFRILSIERPQEIYEDIINQRSNVHYVAANIRLMIESYKTGANFDISQNPGVIASLYNLGGENGRAAALYKKNLTALKQGTLLWPVENYYGFYINEKETTLRQAFAKWAM